MLVENSSHHVLDGEREHVPTVLVGQSGTARPDPVLVTGPPAEISSTVAAGNQFCVRCSHMVSGILEGVRVEGGGKERAFPLPLATTTLPL